jgi:hypothetical protein
MRLGKFEPFSALSRHDAVMFGLVLYTTITYTTITLPRHDCPIDNQRAWLADVEKDSNCAFPVGCRKSHIGDDWKAAPN